MLQEHLRVLLDLQEVDERIAAAKLLQRRLPEQVAAEHTEYREAEARLNEAQARRDGIEEGKRERELELATQEDHLAHLKTRLKDIGNTREYQAYIQEMDGVQRAISKLEDEILQLLSDADEVDEELKSLREGFASHKGVYLKERAKVDAELARLEVDVQAQEGIKAERAERVENGLLRRYKRICITMRRALVPIQEDPKTRALSHCGGCNMRVPPQLVSEVKRGKRIHDCPHCHRLLYVSDALTPSGAPSESP